MLRVFLSLVTDYPFGLIRRRFDTLPRRDRKNVTAPQIKPPRCREHKYHKRCRTMKVLPCLFPC